VAASMLTAIYHMLTKGAVYQDLGADHFHQSSPQAHAQRLAKQIAKLGFTCTPAPAQQAEAVSI
jgi:transposase